MASRGKTVHRLNIRKDKPSDDELAALLLGPSGNLRAPALLVTGGTKTLLIGFDQAAYAEALGPDAR